MTARLLTFAQCGSVVIGFTAAWFSFGPVTVQSAVVISATSMLLIWGMRVAGSWHLGYPTGVVTGVLVMSSLGLVVSFDLLGALWVAALIGTAAPVRKLLHRHLRRHQVTAGLDPRRTATRPIGYTSTTASCATQRPPADQVPDLRELGDLDLGGLCLMWQRTYFQLLDSGGALHAAAVVNYRQSILDEMDHRAPMGLQRWLASAPRASSNPLPFLQSHAACPDDEHPPL